MPDKKPPVHTVPNPDGGWNNKQGGKIVSRADTKAEAQKKEEKKLRKMVPSIEFITKTER